MPMFITSNAEMPSGRASVLGEFVKIDGSYVVLRTSKGTINVLPRGFDSYKTKYILVTGIVENGILEEEHVQKVEDDFDFELFTRLTKQLSKHPEIF